MSMTNVRHDPRLELGSAAHVRALEFVREQLDRGQTSARTLSISVPAPIAPCENILTLTSDSDAWLWAPTAEFEFAGVGQAELLTGEGPERFRQIERQAAEVWSRLEHIYLDDAPPLRLYGGFAFQPGRVRTATWQNFGEARFGLPEFGYLRQGAKAWLTLSVRAEKLRDTAQCRALVAETSRLLGGLDAQAAPHSQRRTLRAKLHERPEAEWAELIESIRAQIERGAVEKIVAARRVELELEAPTKPEHVLARLRSEAPECLRFAFRASGRTFLGATPERLISKSGLELSTEAVAGSVRAGDVASASKLLESHKDIREHEFVVREVLRCLEPLTQSLVCAPKREIHKLRHVLHLRTKISGTLAEPSNVLQLVARLHPTPAVGGVPTSAALAWIEEHEPDERGWYAGPIGWVDAAGDGEFAVAIRSGVLRDKHADLYVGAGVVRDSTAESEFAETRWKLASLLSAFGVQA
jgi:isochorismate synthase